MTEPAKFDDDWAELARELERDKPSSLPSPTASPSPTANASAAGEEAFSDYPSEGMEEATSDEFDDAGEGSDDAGESEPNGDAASGDGQPGTGRKRRRRRRRRRKGGQPAEAGAAEESEKAEDGDGEAEEESFELVPKTVETHSSEPEYADEPADEVAEDGVEISAAEMEEDAGGELLRELIANWNVPSWDDVVGGLYRPER